MDEFFGVLTPALLIAVISGVVQWAKITWKFDGLKADLLSLALNYLLLTAYHIITTYLYNPPASGWETAWVIFTALVYPLLGWLMATGIYYKVIKPVAGSG